MGKSAKATRMQGLKQQKALNKEAKPAMPSAAPKKAIVKPVAAAAAKKSKPTKAR